MKTLLLTLGLMASTTATADVMSENIDIVCGFANEVATASYFNSQEGTPKAVTKSRTIDAFAEYDQYIVDYMLGMVEVSYSLPKPPVSMSVRDAAKTVGIKVEASCHITLRKAIEEESDKVGM